MAAVREFVRRIVSKSGTLRSATRREIERELLAHFEDAIEEGRGDGRDDERVFDDVCGRFGNPEDVARAFELAFRSERRVLLTADAVILLCVSVLTVAALILGFQLVIATSLRIPPSHAFPRLRGECVAFVSLAAGYMGLYMEGRWFHHLPLARHLGLITAIFVRLFALVSSALHLAMAAPALAFVSGLTVCALQKTSLRRVWYLGTIVPTVLACLNTGRLLGMEGETSLFAAVVVRWLGMTAACYALTLLSRNHEARFPTPR